MGDQTKRFPYKGTLPTAEGISLKVVHLHREVPGHWNLIKQHPVMGLATPESWTFNTKVLDETPTLIGPPLFPTVCVTSSFHKLKELCIAHQHLACSERLQFLQEESFEDTHCISWIWYQIYTLISLPNSLSQP